jgi:carbonyl reductase 1
MQTLISENSSWEMRISLTFLEMDTSQNESVQKAAEEFGKTLNTNSDNSKLYAIVNNAGIGSGTISEIVEVNFRGPQRVDAAFLEFLDPENGRIVHISSGGGVRCVQKSSEERRKVFLDENINIEQLDQLTKDLLACDGNTKACLKKHGFGAMNGPAAAAYGASKALLNFYTVMLAREHPKLKINACSPGMIATDFFHSANPTSSFCKICCPMCCLRKLLWSPDEGTTAPIKLLFSEELDGNGGFYHKTGEKTGLDRY